VLYANVVPILFSCKEKYSCTDDALMNRGLATFLESGKAYFIDFNKDIYIRNVFNVAERRREASIFLKAETFLAVR
jgi:hypothetical protein